VANAIISIAVMMTRVSRVEFIYESPPFVSQAMVLLTEIADRRIAIVERIPSLPSIALLGMGDLPFPTEREILLTFVKFIDTREMPGQGNTAEQRKGLSSIDLNCTHRIPACFVGLSLSLLNVDRAWGLK
jgi:hypothetical protein